jgi:hypothetical protein
MRGVCIGKSIHLQTDLMESTVMAAYLWPGLQSRP